MSSYIEDCIEAKRQHIKFTEKQILELEKKLAGEKEYSITVDLVEVYIVKAESEDQAMEMYEEGIAGVPERHYFEIPSLEER